MLKQYWFLTLVVVEALSALKLNVLYIGWLHFQLQASPLPMCYKTNAIFRIYYFFIEKSKVPIPKPWLQDSMSGTGLVLEKSLKKYFEE
jgi:hypothetical protein